MTETGERKGKMERTSEKGTAESGDIKVSVVMPVLNGMPYFEKALGSVASQTMRELEILVVDAGSTDGTVEYVRGMQERDARIRLFHSDVRNSGYQRNFGIREAKGEYIGFCDADDYLELSMFEELYRAAEEADKPDTVKGDYYMFITRETGEELSLYYHILPPKMRSLYGSIGSLRDNQEMYERDGVLWHGIFRRNFLADKQIRLNEIPGASYSDFGFTGQVNMLAGRQLFIEKAFYHYRRDNEKSSVYKKDKIIYIPQECRYMLRFLETHTEEKPLFFAYTVNKILSFMKEVYQKNDYSETESEQEQEEMCRFIEDLQNTIQSLTPAQRSQLWNINELTLLLHDRGNWWKCVREIYRGNIEAAKSFYDYIAMQDKTVIFGAGEMGRALLAFLAANNYKGNIMFCDSNLSVQGTEVMGYPAVFVEQAAEMWRDAVYCVPSPQYYTSMRKQLLQLGIPAERIIASPSIYSHLSLCPDYRVNAK